MSLERITAQTRAVQAALSRAAGGRPVPGNAVSLLVDGPRTYEVMREVIRGARQWIHFENYIIRSDDEGWGFARLLAERARAGVHVRVQYDWIGSLGTRRHFWNFLREAGCEVRAFGPPRPLDPLRILSRNHRKLVVADGADAVIGGLCIGCEWTGDGGPASQPWRDTAVRVRGPAASALDGAFRDSWAIAGGTVPADDEAGSVGTCGDAEVRTIVGEPGKERAYRLIELLSTGVRERLWITDAYFVAPQRLLQCFRDAARDGVDVRVLVPGSSDLPLVRNLTRIGYRDLLRSGVRIFEWDGPMLHAKTAVVDGRWVRVGSSNLNPASLVGNFELDVLVDDPALAEEMERQFRLDLARSAEITRRPVRLAPRISKRLPTALERQPPEELVHHRRSGKERRRRAVVAVRIMASHARRSVFVPAMIGLAILAVLFLLLPRIMAYVFGAICLWLAIGAGQAAFRRRADR